MAFLNRFLDIVRSVDRKFQSSFGYIVTHIYIHDDKEWRKWSVTLRQVWHRRPLYLLIFCIVQHVKKSLIKGHVGFMSFVRYSFILAWQIILLRMILSSLVKYNEEIRITEDLEFIVLHISISAWSCICHLLEIFS